MKSFENLFLTRNVQFEWLFNAKNGLFNLVPRPSAQTKYFCPGLKIPFLTESYSLEVLELTLVRPVNRVSKKVDYMYITSIKY